MANEVGRSGYHHHNSRSDSLWHVYVILSLKIDKKEMAIVIVGADIRHSSTLIVPYEKPSAHINPCVKASNIADNWWHKMS